MSRYFTVCYQCPDRHVGCHKDCERYLAEKQAYEQIKEKRKKHLDLESAFRRFKSRR